MDHQNLVSAFDLDRFESPSPSQLSGLDLARKIVETVRDRCMAFPTKAEKPFGLWISGAPAVGKTHLLFGMVNELGKRTPWRCEVRLSYWSSNRDATVKGMADLRGNWSPTEITDYVISHENTDYQYGRVWYKDAISDVIQVGIKTAGKVEQRRVDINAEGFKDFLTRIKGNRSPEEKSMINGELQEGVLWNHIQLIHTSQELLSVSEASPGGIKEAYFVDDVGQYDADVDAVSEDKWLALSTLSERALSANKLVVVTSNFDLNEVLERVKTMNASGSVASRLGRFTPLVMQGEPRRQARSLDDFLTDL